jgi:hypothetical protein
MRNSEIEEFGQLKDVVEQPNLESVVRGIGGEVCALAHQQLADSIHRLPEFESLSLRQFFGQV